MAFHQIKPGYRLCKLSDDFQMHIKLMPLDFFISLCQRRHRYCFKRMQCDELFITREITRFGILKKNPKIPNQPIARDLSSVHLDAGYKARRKQKDRFLGFVVTSLTHSVRLQDQVGFLFLLSFVYVVTFQCN